MWCYLCGVFASNSELLQVGDRSVCTGCLAEHLSARRRAAQQWIDQYEYLTGTLPPLLRLMVSRRLAGDEKHQGRGNPCQGRRSRS